MFEGVQLFPYCYSYFQLTKSFILRSNYRNDYLRYYYNIYIILDIEYQFTDKCFYPKYLVYQKFRMFFYSVN